MKQGLLAKHFKGIAAKRLSAVEANREKSNQHEYNGTRAMEQIFGKTDRPFTTRFIWFGDEQDVMAEDGTATWYDSRAGQPHRKAEFRMYFPDNAVTQQAKEGDTLFVALRTDDSVLIVVTPSDSTIQAQLMWLFGLPEQPRLKFEVKEVSDDSSKLDFAVRYIFDELEIEFEEPEGDYLDSLLVPYGMQFPSMAEFSALARKSLPDVSALDDPDKALVAWLDREEFLFKRLERHILGERLKRGFMAGGEPDFESFNQVSLSVQNRRKARAGAALENHLEHLFRERKILHGRGCETENKYRPDFLFPGCAQYRSSSFPPSSLTMLGAKSTLKERWRQVFSEAARIEVKHLLTLSPGISINQTDQMRAGKVQLIVPAGLHSTYQASQQAWLMTLGQFLVLVADRQRNAPS